jgi:hypothetical protein
LKVMAILIGGAPFFTHGAIRVKRALAATYYFFAGTGARTSCVPAARWAALCTMV